MIDNAEKKGNKNMEHHFNVEIAKEYGILEAVILNNFQHWIENKNNSAWKGDVTIDGIYYNLSTLKDCLEEIYAII